MEKIMVTRSSIAPYEEYIDEIKDMWDSRWLTNMGVKHCQLERALSEYLDVPYVMLTTNGHAALEVAIQALGLRGEIITTPFTFISTTNAIIRSGCTPVFCDVNDRDYTIDVNKIEELITDKTSAILPVHVYGNVCDNARIQEIAKKHNIKVLYDAAHAFGVRKDGQSIATFGDISIFSFHATKVFNTIEGGAICCQDSEIAQRITKIRDFGISSETTVEYVGTNAKMNEFSAAMGLCNLRHLPEEIEKRKIAVERYRQNLGKIKGIKILYDEQNLNSNYAYFPVIIDKETFPVDRDVLCDKLAQSNIYARKYFYPLTNSQPCVLDHCDRGNTPVADCLSKRVLTLPLYADLKISDVDRICEVIYTFLR